MIAIVVPQAKRLGTLAQLGTALQTTRRMMMKPTDQLCSVFDRYPLIFSKLAVEC